MTYIHACTYELVHTHTFHLHHISCNISWPLSRIVCCVNPSCCTNPSCSSLPHCCHLLSACSMDVCRTHADPQSISARPPRKRTRVGDAAASSSAYAPSSSSSATDFSSAAASIFGAAALFDLFGNVNNRLVSHHIRLLSFGSS